MKIRVIKLNEVIEKTALSKSTIYSRIKEGSFVEPIKLGSRAVGFLEGEVDEWIQNRVADSRNSGEDK